MFHKNSALFFILSVCLIVQVSSKKCYVCDSKSDKNCTSKNLKPYEQNCDGNSIKNSQFLTEIITTLVDSKKQKMDFSCDIVTGTELASGESIIYRTCLPKFISLDTIKIIGMMHRYPMQVEEFKRCDSELCNSSGHLKAGFFSLLLSLLAAYLMKF